MAQSAFQAIPGDTGATGATGSTGATGADGGLAYTYSTDTASSDPGSGILKFNSTTLASITSLRISETDRFSGALATLIATWDDSTSTNKTVLIMTKEGSPGNVLVLMVSGSITDNGAWDTVPVTYVASNGSFANSDHVQLVYSLVGNKGDTGAAGAGGVAVVATTVAGLGTGVDGVIGAIRAGSTPYDFITVIYDATYGKWVSAPIPTSEFLGSATTTSTTYTGVTDSWIAYTIYATLATAGLAAQFRGIYRGHISGGATVSVAINIQGGDAAGALTAMGSTQISVGTTTSATDVFMDGGWVGDTITSKAFVFGHFQFKSSSGAQTATLVNAASWLRWVA